jgi:hypothetical protein
MCVYMAVYIIVISGHIKQRVYMAVYTFFIIGHINIRRRRDFHQGLTKTLKSLGSGLYNGTFECRCVSLAPLQFESTIVQA